MMAECGGWFGYVVDDDGSGGGGGSGNRGCAKAV